jgi:hypothetical protein
MLTGSIGLCMPLRRHGVQLQTSLDFNTIVPVEMMYDQESSNWDLKYFIPKQQYDMFSFQAWPATHIDKLSKTSWDHPYVWEGKEIQNPKFIKPFVMQVSIIKACSVCSMLRLWSKNSDFERWIFHIFTLNL